jgi:hypothetical protein
MKTFKFSNNEETRVDSDGNVVNDSDGKKFKFKIEEMK